MKYIDVMLPLPLEGTFTYSVSEEMAKGIAMGVRVLVPFGKSKTYTGLCTGSAYDTAIGIELNKVKDVISVIDGRPALFPQQMKLW